MKTVDIKEFSKYIIYYFNHRGELLTNKKLQKLLYYIQAWHLVYFNDKLFNEIPEAWVHGPVFPSVYGSYKKFKAKPIIFDKGISREDLVCLLESFELTDNQKEYIEAVINTYGRKSALELEILSHKEKPWVEARRGLTDFDLCSNPINLDTMKSYYSELKARSKK
jgi:uncharacterized phage-associated protein